MRSSTQHSALSTQLLSAVCFRHRAWRTSLVVWLGVLVSGCAPANREDLTKQVLKTDPEFAAVLDKHRELTNRIATFERELALKRTTVERSIAQLRKDLAVTAENVKGKIGETKKRMDPDQKRLDLELAAAGEELQTKRFQRATLGRSIARIRKALKSNTAGWSAQEQAHQQAQLDEMLRDAARLDQEMSALKEHVRLLKIKLLLIKL